MKESKEGRKVGGKGRKVEGKGRKKKDHKKEKAKKGRVRRERVRIDAENAKKNILKQRNLFERTGGGGGGSASAGGGGCVWGGGVEGGAPFPTLCTCALLRPSLRFLPEKCGGGRGGGEGRSGKEGNVREKERERMGVDTVRW
jgi:hypothetical protein